MYATSFTPWPTTYAEEDEDHFLHREGDTTHSIMCVVHNQGSGHNNEQLEFDMKAPITKMWPWFAQRLRIEMLISFQVIHVQVRIRCRSMWI